MKFTTTAFLTAAVAVASVSALPNAAPSVTPLAETPTAKCLKKCPTDDNYANCAAQCVGVPSPNSADTQDTRKCVAACDQGDGSAEATERYAECSSKCFKSYFFSSGTVLVPSTPAGGSTATGTSSGSSTTSTGKGSGGSNGGSNGGSGSGSGSGSDSGSGSGSSSDSSSTSSSSGFANGLFQPSNQVAGIASFLIAVLAL